MGRCSRRALRLAQRVAPRQPHRSAVHRENCRPPGGLEPAPPPGRAKPRRRHTPVQGKPAARRLEARPCWQTGFLPMENSWRWWSFHTTMRKNKADWLTFSANGGSSPEAVLPPGVLSDASPRSSSDFVLRSTISSNLLFSARFPYAARRVNPVGAQACPFDRLRVPSEVEGLRPF